MSAKIAEDNERWHRVFTEQTGFRCHENGSIERGNEIIRYGAGGNPKIGTHFFQTGYALKGRGVNNG